MNFRRWTAGLEWSLLAAVVAVHIAIWLSEDWLTGNLGLVGPLILEAAAFVQVSLLVILAVWGPGWNWFRGLAMLAVAGWTIPHLVIQDAPTPNHMRQLFLLFTATTFLGAVVSRLAGVRVVRAPADGHLDRGGAKFSIRGLLILTTIVAALAALAGWVRPYLAYPTIIVNPNQNYQNVLMQAAAIEEAVSMRTWYFDIGRPTAMTLGLATTTLLAAIAVLRPGTTWMRLAALATTAPLLGWYVAYLTASSTETGATFAAFFSMVAAMVAGSLMPIRLMNYRLLRPARKVAGTLRVPTATREISDTMDDGTRSVPATFGDRPMKLEQIDIASPCHANWDEMSGDDRARFCQHCSLHVYNLSDLSRDEAEKFVQGREGRMCVRFFRRADGTVLTRDCPVGLRLIKPHFVRAVAAMAGLLVALISGTLFAGRLKNVQVPNVGSPSRTYSEWIEPGSTFTAVMGACPPPQRPITIQTGDETALEPAESPLPEPTVEQLQEIQFRLTK